MSQERYMMTMSEFGNVLKYLLKYLRLAILMAVTQQRWRKLVVFKNDLCCSIKPSKSLRSLFSGLLHNPCHSCLRFFSAHTNTNSSRRRSAVNVRKSKDTSPSSGARLFMRRLLDTYPPPSPHFSPRTTLGARLGICFRFFLFVVFVQS